MFLNIILLKLLNNALRSFFITAKTAKIKQFKENWLEILKN